jgi:hypothetical protein
MAIPLYIGRFRNPLKPKGWLEKILAADAAQRKKEEKAARKAAAKRVMILLQYSWLSSPMLMIPRPKSKLAFKVKRRGGVGSLAGWWDKAGMHIEETMRTKKKRTMR